MRYPKFLPDNGTIGYVAPSFGCATEPYISTFKNTLKRFEAAGYKNKLGPNCTRAEGIGISSTPQNCGKELVDAYCDIESDVLISCGGGELMCEILDFVDFDLIGQKAPKWFMGYSDNTNFTFTLTTICDVATVYGPCASSFGTETNHQCLEDSIGILNGKKVSPQGKCLLEGYDKWELQKIKSEENPLAGYNLTEDSCVRGYIGDGKPMEISGSNITKMADSVEMQGRLLGGCLDCLSMLCGTKYDNVAAFNEKYAEDGIIWFLEACELNPMSIRRTMWQLEHAGWFEKTRGFIIGRPLMYGEELMGLDNYKAFYDVISHYKVPIIMDADLGHLPPSMPLITGSMAKVRCEGTNWSVQMHLV